MKKITLLLLTFALLFVLGTVTVFADDVENVAEVNGTEYATIEAAISAAQENDEVTLLKDVTLSQILTINKPITLNGNGKTITSTAARAINVETTGDVKIHYLTVNAQGERAINIIQKPVSLTISNVNATAYNYAVNVAGSSVGSTIFIADSTLKGLNVVNVGATDTQITIEGGTIICDDQSESENYGAISLNDNATGSKVVATGVAFEVKGDSLKAVNSAENGQIIIDETEDEEGKMVALIQYGENFYSFTTLEAAVQSAKSGDTIKILKDIALDKTITIAKGQDIVIDLNGYNITYLVENTPNENTYAILNDGTLTVTDTSESGNGQICLVYTGETVSRTISTICNRGIINVVSGTINADSGVQNISYAIDNNSTISDAVINVSGGAVIGGASAYSIRLYANSTKYDNALNVTGGTIWYTLLQGVNSYANKASVDISGGLVYYVCVTQPSNGVIKCSNYELNLNSAYMEYEPYFGELENGYFVDSANGVYEIKKAVAQVGNEKFATLDEAFQYANAQGGAEAIVVLSDTTLGAISVINATLDLNGCTVTSTGSYFFLLQGGSLKVVDTSAEKTGKLNGVTTGNAFIMYGEGSSLELDGVSVLSNNNVLFTYYSGNTVSIKDSTLESVIDTGNVFYLCGTETTVEIDGGTYICYNSASSNVFADFAGTAISVKAGSFVRDVSAYCKNGYGCEFNEETGYYEVKEVSSESYVAMIGDVGYTSLSAAMNAANANDTIVILCDVTESMTIIKGNLVCGNENGVTITNTLVDDWAYATAGFVLGEGITYTTTNNGGICVYGSECVINGTAIIEAYYQIAAGSKLTINAPGSLTVTTETFIIRNLNNDASAGIYVNGDQNSDTKEIEAVAIYFYQGTISAKDATILVGVYNQTQDTDNQASASLILDNSTLSAWVAGANVRVTGDTIIVLKNGSVLNSASGITAPNTAITVDETSKFAIKNMANSQVPSDYKFEANADGTYTVKAIVRLSDIFGYKGTSTNGTSMTTGYTLNHEKLAEYMAQNGISSVEFGGVMAAGSINAYAKYFDFTNLAKTSNYNIIIRDVTEEYYDLALVMTLYVSFDGEEKKFVNKEANLVDKTEAPTITYNEAKGDEE